MSCDSGIETKVASTGMHYTKEICLRTNCRLSITNNHDKMTSEVSEESKIQNIVQRPLWKTV